MTEMMRQYMKFPGKVVTINQDYHYNENLIHLASTYSDLAAVGTVLGLKCTFAVFIKSFQSISVSLGYCPGNLNYLIKGCFQFFPVLPLNMIAL